MYRYADYTKPTAEDIVRIRRRLRPVPAKETDRNLLVATWNIRAFGDLTPVWDETDESPKRNLRGLAIIAEVIRRFDVVAIQEVKRETTAIRTMIDRFLGPEWGLLTSDATEGDKGNSERLAYVYDRRRVTPSGLAGEIVVPPPDGGEELPEQFDRTPYIAGFRSGGVQFALLSAHIRYGDGAADRRPELLRLASYTARYLRDRATPEEQNLIVLGDFNIDERSLDDPLFEAFVSEGLVVPRELLTAKSTTGGTVKHYDQIAWFIGHLDIPYRSRAGYVDFTDTVFPELTGQQMTWRVSDHFPLWVEFGIDRSVDALADTLGTLADPAALEDAVD